MPSLPPPLSLGAEEPLPLTAGSRITRPGYDARILDDGSLVINERFLRRDGFLGATFDVGDTLIHLFTDNPGLDPYLSDKLDLLHETFAERVELRRKYNEQTMDRALDALPQYLSAVWDAPGWDLPTKRRILFALWDECAEDGSALVVDGGHAARETITAFIGQRLPEGSQQGYTDEELSGFNQIRTSRLAFAPPPPNL